MGSLLRATSSSLPPSPPSQPTNDDIEAVIQMATSARLFPDGRAGPLKDTRTQLFVGNLPYRVRWQDLKDLFRKAGTVLRADVSLGPDNRSRGYGTVLLATAEDAGRAMDMFHGYSWQTRVLEVRPDRLPPDFDNLLGNSGGAVGGFNVSGSPISLGLAVASAGVGAPSDGGFSMSSSLENYDHNSLFGLDRPGSSSNGGRNLFVGNLPFHCQWQDLKDLFRQAGTIVRADVASGVDGRSRGFGTVAFATELDADRAVKMFNGYEYNGRLLKVHVDKFSQSTQPMASPPSPSLHGAFRHTPSFSSQMESPPPHISMPIGYMLDFGPSSGPSSPFDIYPPNLSMSPQPQPITHQQAYPQSQSPPKESPLPNTQSSSQQQQPHNVDVLSATLLNTSISTTTPQRPSSKCTTSSQSPRPRQSHHHPGPISLPPPGPVFPQPVSLSPHGHPLTPLHHPMSPIHHHHHHHHHPHSPLTPSHYPHMIPITPHGLPPITPSMPPFTFLPQPSPHNHPSQNHNNPNGPLSTPPVHINTNSSQQIISSFSPGVAMSPGAFWGRPGGANPFINPAVGAPVHGSPSGFFGIHAVSPPAMEEEPAGYFPPVPVQQDPLPPPPQHEQDYFPPVSTAFGLEPSPPPPSSMSLANEVLRHHHHSSLERYPEEDHGEGLESSPSRSSATGTGSGGWTRRPSSSNGTSWNASDCEEGGLNEKREELLGIDGLHEDDHHPISRSQSVNASERPASLEIVGRSDSDPIQVHSREPESGVVVGLD